MLADSSRRTEMRIPCEDPVRQNIANGCIDNASEQETQIQERDLMMGGICENKPERDKQPRSGLLHRCRSYFAKGSKWKHSTIGISILLAISVTINIYLWAKPHQVPAAPSPLDTTSDASPCPQDWVLNEGQCYSFSDTEETWDACKTYCSSQGGSLLAMVTPQEWGFVMASRPHIYFWLDFRREEVGKPWKRANGSLFNNWFPIAGEGLCSYINDINASSTMCGNIRHCTCTKSIRGH